MKQKKKVPNLIIVYFYLPESNSVCVVREDIATIASRVTAIGDMLKLVIMAQHPARQTIV